MNKYTLGKQKTLSELCVKKDEEIADLQNTINALREAFTEMDKQLISMGSKGATLKTSAYQDALRAFSKAPAQHTGHKK